MIDNAVFDAHSDLPFSVIREREAGRSAVIEEDFLPEMRAGNIKSRVVAVYLDDAYLPEMALHRALTIVSELRDDIKESDGVELATTPKEITGATESENVTLILGMEGAEPLMGDPRLLPAFYRSGLRVLTLTHSRRNAVGEGALLSGHRRGTPGGLSEPGIDIIERAEDLGIVVDLSHLNKPGFEDAIDVAAQPVIASHSNCRALCDHPRNLTDDQIQAVVATGGIVCLTAVGSFLGDSPDVTTLCDHIQHAVDTSGVDHVGLGLDFFTYLLEYLSEPERQRLEDISPVDGLQSDSAVTAIPTALDERGFSAQEISKICYGNLQRVFEDVLS